MYVSVCESPFVCVSVCMYVSLCESPFVCVSVCMYVSVVCVSVCMYVSVCECVCVRSCAGQPLPLLRDHMTNRVAT